MEKRMFCVALEKRVGVRKGRGEREGPGKLKRDKQKKT